MSGTKEEGPGTAAQGVAKLCVYIGTLVLFTWGGALLEHFHLAGVGGLIWYALAWFVAAFGFMLFCWGARSAVRHAAKSEDGER